jgi:sulfoxide reductase heme-binding subunit YedZ
MPKKKKRKTADWLRYTVHVSALIPFAVMIRDYFTNNLTVNPIQELTQRTGDTAVILLVLSLAITPLISLTKFHALAPSRRPLGVYAFAYAFVHVLIFVAVDYGLNWGLVLKTIIEKQFTIVGALTILMMIPLAITSTKGWQKRLGKKWKTLHKLAYVIGPMAILHYVWALKADISLPLIFGAIIVILLILRLPYIKKNFNTRIAAKLKNMRLKTTPTT